MDSQTAFPEFENRNHRSRVLTQANGEKAQLESSERSNSSLDVYRRSDSSLPPCEYALSISEEEIGSGSGNRMLQGEGVGTVRNDVRLLGHASGERGDTHPLVARVSKTERRPAQTRRPRADPDRRRTERLIATSNFNQSKADNGF